MRLWRWSLGAAAAAGLVWLGCATAFAPEYLLAGPRILALRATPTELVPDGGVVLDALIWAPGNPTLSWTWSWCPALGGADDNYACTITQQALSTDLSPDGGITLDYTIGSTSSVTFTYPVAPAVLHSLCRQGFTPVVDAGPTDGGTLDGGAVDAGPVDGGLGPDGGPLPVLPDGGLGVLTCGSTLSASMLLTLGVEGEQLTAEAPLTFSFDGTVVPHSSSQLLGLELFAPGSSTPIAAGSTLEYGVAYTVVAEVPEDATLEPTADAGLAPDGGSLDAGAAVPVDAGPDVDGGFVFVQGTRYGAVSLAWYVQAGALAAGTTNLPATVVFDGGADGRDWSRLEENVWVTPSSGSSAELIVVLRDDDDGVDWITQTWTLGPAAVH